MDGEVLAGGQEAMATALMQADDRINSHRMDTNRHDTHDHAALISSAKVQGSNVYRLNGERVGRIEHMMIDKTSGRVAYAVMSAGGVMGGGHDFYPLPWSLLGYNDRLGGYEFDVSEEHLRDAPKFSAQFPWDWTDLTRGRRIHDYWRALPYWGF